MDSYDVHVHPIQFSDKESFWTFNIIKNIFKYRKIKGKGVIFFKAAHIQCKQCVLPRSLELREDFQTHWWPYSLEDNENRVVSHTSSLHP
jgi:hypothetical protein